MITKNPTSRTLIIHTVGNLDALTADHYRGELRSLISEGYRYLIFDLEETPYMNSSGLGLLVEFYNTVRRVQGSIKLINCSEQVNWLLEQTHINTLFSNQPAIPSESDATAPVPAFDSLHDLMSDEIRVLSLVNEFIVKALKEDDPRIIGQILLSGVLKALRANYGALMLLDEAGESLELVHLEQKKIHGILPTQLIVPLANDRLETQILGQDEAVWHHITDKDLTSSTSIFGKLGFEWMLAAPICGDSRRFGLMAIEAADHTQNIFQAAKPLIMTFANTGGLAMEKATLLHSGRRKDTALSSSLQHAESCQDSLHNASRLAAMGTVTTGLTHLLNNQMVPLLGYTQLLRQSFDLTEEISRKVDCIYESVVQVNRTLEKVLRLTQLNSPSFEPINIEEIIQTVVHLLQSAIEQAGIEIHIHSPQSLDAISGNADFLKQTFLAILHRAIVGLSGDDAPAHPWIRIVLSLSGENLRIIFEDNGDSLTHDDFEEIIDPIPSIEEINKGHIFTYNIPRSLIRRHNGRLNLERRKDFGKRVIIDLPTGDCDEAVLDPEPDMAHSPQ